MCAVNLGANVHEVNHLLGKELVEADLYRALVEHVNDHAVYMLDPEGVVVTWNEGAERIKGYKAAEIIGRKFDCFFTPEDRERGKPQEVLKAALRDGEYKAEEIRVREDGSRFWAHVVLQPLKDRDGNLIGFASSTGDVTEYRQVREELERARAAFGRSQKLEAIGEFAGRLAHDFGNLLMAVRLNLDCLRGQLSSASEAVLQAAIAEVERGSEAVRSILIFARHGSLETRVTDLKFEIEQMAGLLRQAIGQHSTLEIAIPRKLWPVKVNANQLELALLNLAINARDAMPEGGHYRIAAANVSLKGSPEGLAGDFVALSVVDSGSGMSSDVAAKAIEPFFTTKEEGKGSGLGLSQVYGFAKDCGGAMTLESAAGKGTTITIYVPRYVGKD
jgi:PAS domain S-box-containing protein